MKLPKSFYNNISLVGAFVSTVSLFLIICFFIVSFLFGKGGAYLGLYAYILLPGVLLLGLILIPIGMFYTIQKSRKLNQPLPSRRLIIDFNIPQNRNAAATFIIGSIILMILTTIGSYEAFHYTESVNFCGTVCHQVMEPEYVTYQNSSHAKVKCVECHVGEGADWYVKSKLSGLYQVYSVIMEKYPRPIPTPISNLRPARETCLECHWPEKFYSTRIKHKQHFLSDSLNSEWNISLKMNIGGSHYGNHLKEGIHWHINPNVKIEYISTDEKREFIPWVRYINLTTNDTVIYQDTWMPLEESEIKTATLQQMDCMDCHNRPSHKYLVPSEFIDITLASGTLPKLPYIKSVAMEILKNEYATRDSALFAIRNTISDFYSEEYDTIPSDSIKVAIKVISEAYLKNVFPEMKASWDVYPDHIGHKVFNGCFRCHNDTHESAFGQKITRDCEACHSILSQGLRGKKHYSNINSSLAFKHPVDIELVWKESLCTDCHRYLYP